MKQEVSNQDDVDDDGGGDQQQQNKTQKKNKHIRQYLSVEDKGKETCQTFAQQKKK